jgi:hypothetical protein
LADGIGLLDGGCTVVGGGSPEASAAEGLRRIDARSSRAEGQRTTQGIPDYGPFLVHRRTRLTVRNERGETVDLELFGSILETGGSYKLFSYRVD